MRIFCAISLLIATRASLTFTITLPAMVVMTVTVPPATKPRFSRCFLTSVTVTKADPGVKGDTATNVTKPATVETGAEIKVPLFINEGEKIQIDTRTGEYLGRVKG